MDNYFYCSFLEPWMNTLMCVQGQCPGPHCVERPLISLLPTLYFALQVSFVKGSSLWPSIQAVTVCHMDFLPGLCPLLWGDYNQMCLCDWAVLLLAGTVTSQLPASGLFSCLCCVSLLELWPGKVHCFKTCNDSHLLKTSLLRCNLLAIKCTKLEYVIQRF